MRHLKKLAVVAAAMLSMPAQAADFVHSGTTSIAGPVDFWRVLANPIQFDVSGLTTVDDVNITISGLTHNGSADLVMALTSPTGTTVLFMDSAGSWANWSNATITFDQDASGKINYLANQYGGNNGNIPSGSYKPSVYGLGTVFAGFALNGSNLDAFDGEDANGTWKLYIGDAGLLGRGSFTGATLSIASATAPVPEPASWAMMIAGLGMLGATLRARPRATVAAA